MAIVLPKSLDRSTLRMITIKRSVTGSASVVAALALLIYGLVRFAELNEQSRLYWVAAVVIFAFGGVWSLRDALRGWKMLKG